MGTESVMKACIMAKVKRIVVTSSDSAILKKGKPYMDEEDWSDPNVIPPYDRSKLFAEQIVWKMAAHTTDDY